MANGPTSAKKPKKVTRYATWPLHDRSPPPAIVLFVNRPRGGHKRPRS
jgi:hypothetical protein